MERQQWTPWNAGGTFSLYNVAVVCVGVQKIYITHTTWQYIDSWVQDPNPVTNLWLTYLDD